VTDKEQEERAPEKLEDDVKPSGDPIILEKTEETAAADDSAAADAVKDVGGPPQERAAYEAPVPIKADSRPAEAPTLGEVPHTLTHEEQAEANSLIAALEQPAQPEEEDGDAKTAEGVNREGEEDLYTSILNVLHTAGDLGIDVVAKGRISEGMKSDRLPQLVCRDLINGRTINNLQLARAVARAQGHMEIMSFLDLPPEAMPLRQELPDAVATLLRGRRIIPLRMEEAKEGRKTLHLAHEASARDLVLEAALTEMFPGHSFVWHFSMREVAGAYWLAGENEDVDTGMEAEALLDRIIGNAIDARSSDIHIDPSIRGEPRAIVKYRVDGSVMPKEVITSEQLDRLRVRIENLARMPKVNLNHPNKGSFSRAGFDWRVQIQPHSSPFGPVPRIVLRQLKPDVMPMEALGYPQYFTDKIKAGAQAPNGVVLWTGPTGSGKTESIHSAIVSVNPMAKGLSVHTIEDPPEKRVPGYAIQMEAVEEDEPRSALQLLKSCLRADPDVIVFGEVRDKAMAKLVFEAANTGHLVFSTLHTNTALDAVIRLDELGITGFLVSYIRGIAAQRLVRRLCVHCRQKVDTPDDYTRYVFDRYGVEIEGADLYQANPEGCPSCNYHGYYGRIAVAEWLRPTKELVDATAARQFEDLEDIALRAGWQPMGHMGVMHVKAGITDAAELSRKILELSGDLL
jgi:type II secretory ATPase GspE/PulE/Tfp pilus assembly ATPase PilB-like protein